MKELVAILKQLPMKLVNLLNVIVDGLTAQLKTTRGIVIFIVVVVTFYDIWQKGTMGVIAFVITQVSAILNAILLSVKDVNFGTLLLITIIIIIYLDFKKGPVAK